MFIWNCMEMISPFLSLLFVFLIYLLICFSTAVIIQIWEGGLHVWTCRYLWLCPWAPNDFPVPCWYIFFLFLFPSYGWKSWKTKWMGVTWFSEFLFCPYVAFERISKRNFYDEVSDCHGKLGSIIGLSIFCVWVDHCHDMTWID